MFIVFYPYRYRESYLPDCAVLAGQPNCIVQAVVFRISLVFPLFSFLFFLYPYSQSIFGHAHFIMWDLGL